MIFQPSTLILPEKHVKTENQMPSLKHPKNILHATISQMTTGNFNFLTQRTQNFKHHTFLPEASSSTEIQQKAQKIPI